MPNEPLTAEDRAAYLSWPDRRNCDWDCPWPGYCLECHMAAWQAMWDARSRVLSFMTGVVLEEVRKAIPET